MNLFNHAIDWNIPREEATFARYRLFWFKC